MIEFSEDTTPAPALPEKPTNKKKASHSKKPSLEPPEESSNNQTTSLSFEQVNNNNEELVELRGEGRYFGVDSSGASINAQQLLGPLCANCHKRGHIRAKCKTVVCHKCGVVGDHYETQCPTTMVCAKCGEKGHIAADCTNKQRKREYCKRCDTFSHSDDKCPSIWRLYLTKSKDVINELPPIYCYNCGDLTHFGDECTEPRLLRVPNISGSAFLGLNLPKNLRQRYYDRVRRKAIPRSRNTPNDGYSSRFSNNSNNRDYNSNNNNNHSYNNYNNNGNNGNRSNNFKQKGNEYRNGNTGSNMAPINFHNYGNGKKYNNSNIVGFKSGGNKKSKLYGEPIKKKSKHIPKATRSGMIKKRKN